MKKLIIKFIDKYIYHLEDEKGSIYILNMEFQNIEEDILVKDIVYLDSELLESKTPLTFGPIESIYGRDIKEDNMEEVIIIEKEDKKIYLKRYYG